jgi:biotin transporter BioY
MTQREKDDWHVFFLGFIFGFLLGATLVSWKLDAITSAIEKNQTYETTSAIPRN